MAKAAALEAELRELQERVAEVREEKTRELGQRLGSKPVSFAELKLKCRRVLRGHYGKIYACHWAEDSRTLVSASQDGKLIIWNAFTTNKLLMIPLRSSWVMTCAYSPSGNLVACGGLDNMCTVFRASESASQGGNPRFYELSQHEGYLSCCRFIDDNKIVTSSGDSTCILWDINAKRPIHIYSAHAGDVMSVAIGTPNTFASGSVDCNVNVWDMRDGNRGLVSTMSGHESDVNSVDFSTKGQSGLICSGSDDSAIRVWDVRSTISLAPLRSDQILCGITSVGFSASCRYVFGGYDSVDSQLVGWDTLAGRTAFQVVGQNDRSGREKGHDARVSTIGVTKDGSAVVSGSWDSILRVWG